jgi:alginate O-acetyltransferase complex protein AlgF
MSRARCLPLVAALCAAVPAASFAGPRLYDTGPAQDIALVRFVNAGPQPLRVHSGAKTSLEVPPSAPVTDYLPARSDAPVTGQWQLGGSKLPISLRVKSGGSASAVAWPDADGKLAGASFAEEPAQFDPLRASLAFYNADARCTAGLQAASQGNPAIFENQAALAHARRAVNPVKLAVQATCNGRPWKARWTSARCRPASATASFLFPPARAAG